MNSPSLDPTTDSSSSLSSQDRKHPTTETVTPQTPQTRAPSLDSPATSYSSHTPREGRDLEKNKEDVVIPDGGVRAWLVVFGAWLNYASAFGIMNSFGTFQLYYTHKFSDETASTITWIGSVQLFVLFAAGIVVGPAFDRWGSRKLMSTGTLLLLVSYLAASLSTEYYQILLSQGFLFGIANALLYYPAASCIAEWFDRRRGLALGIAVSGSSAGAIWWPIVTDALLRNLQDVWTMRFLCILTVPPLVLSTYLIVEKKDSSGHDTHGNQVERVGIWQTVTEWHFLWLSAALCLIYCGMLVPFYYIPTRAEDGGLGSGASNTLLSITYGGSVVGRIGAGALSDRLGRFNVMAVISILTGVITFAWIKMDNHSSQIAFAFLFGFFSGGLIPLGSACVAQTTPNMGHIGLRIGAMMAICSVGGLAGGPISGALRNVSDGWGPVCSFSALTVLTGTVLLLAIRRKFEPNWATIY